MPSQRVSSRSYRGLQYQSIPRTETIWVTDNLLAAAFDRFCAVSVRARRRSSHVPGPLESQCRLGKRRMADLNFQQAPSLPPWVLPIQIDTSKLRWQPPTRHRATRAVAPQPSTSVSFLSAVRKRAQREWMKQVGGTEKIMEEDPTRTFGFEKDVDTFCAKLGIWTKTEATAMVKKLRGQLDKRFNNDRECAKHAVLMLQRLFDALDARFPTLGATRLMLYRKMVSGVSQSAVLSPEDIEPAIWDDLLLRMSTLPKFQEHVPLQLLRTVMDQVSAEHLDEVSGGLVAILGNIFSAWATASANSNPASRNTKVELLAEALAKISSQDHGKVLDAVHDLVLHLCQASPPVEAARLRDCWTALLGFMPNVGQDYLFRATSCIFPGTSAEETISNRQLCDLLFRQWISRGYAEYRQFLTFTKQRLSGHEDTVLAVLFIRIFDETRDDSVQRGLIFSCVTFLRHLKRQKDIIACFQAYMAQKPDWKPPSHLLHFVAAACRDLDVALYLHDLYYQTRPESQHSDWHPGIFRRFADELVLDPSLPKTTFWTVLDIGWYDGPRFDTSLLSGARHMGRWRGDVESMRATRSGNKSRHLGTYGKIRAEIVEHSAVAVSNCKGLSPRRAFWHISQCIRFLEEREGKGALSPSVLQALWEVITRDLKKGLPGRQTRFRWYLLVLERNFGEEMTLEAGLTLRRWRSTVLERLKASVGRVRR